MSETIAGAVSADPLVLPPPPMMPETEYDAACAVRDGLLQSGVKIGESRLWAIRITGTGAAYRTGLKRGDKEKYDEFTFRDPLDYLNEQFLQRCNGLIVIFEHPEKSMLNSEEFANRVVGAIVLPYIRDSEVWGIARILDDEVNEILDTEPMSTSPGFLVRPRERISDVDDGKDLLIEGKPLVLDHCALVRNGVWDKGGLPSGVSSTANLELQQMADEKKMDGTSEIEPTVDATATVDRKDGDMDMMDAVMSKFDAMCAKMDARMDAFEKKMDSRKDSEPKEGEEVAADARRDGEEDEKTKAEREAKEKADRKDARKDAAEAKADATAANAAIADMATKLARMEKLVTAVTTTLSDDDHAAFGSAQERADGVALAFNDHAPRPMNGEGVMAYRRRLVGKYQSHSTKWKDIDLRDLKDDAFKQIEGEIFADALAAAASPASVAPGTLREVRRKDRVTGREYSEFYGDPAVTWGDFGIPAQRVGRINRHPDRV